MNADAAELARRQHQLDLLIARDSEIGERAKLRVAKIYGPTATSSIGTYDFSDSFAKRDQVSRRGDWVHRNWLRPIRFFYRHIPKPIRFTIKKFFA
ncbi:MAG: hypothetical protein QNL84_01800 [Acidimicrobiia bacterium]|jgi:hypothetical protein